MKTKQIFITIALWLSASVATATTIAPYNYKSVAKFNQDSVLEVINENPNDNIIYSGPSVYVALSMLATGAQGQTLDDLLKVLNVNDLNELHLLNQELSKLINVDVKDLKILSKNALWVDNNFVVKKQYTNALIQYFDAQVTVLPFAEKPSLAANEINKWANDVSNGLIPQIIDAGEAANLVALINNAVYFKASWAEEFDPKLTKTASFTNADQTTSDIDMMFKYFGETRLRYYQGGSALQVLELPYKTGAKILVALPGNGIAGPLSASEVASSFFAEDFINEFNSNASYVKANVHFPKMDLKTKTQLNQPMINLGLKDLFGRPDLKGISDDSLAVSYIKQDAAIKVNEEGTEAAAITSIGVRTTSIDMTPIVDFNVNKNFLFMIVEDGSNVVLFQGLVQKL